MLERRDKWLYIVRRPIVCAITNFLHGPIYPAIYSLLVLMSSFLGLEIFIFSLTACIFIFICLFSEDTIPIIPLAVLVVYAMSWRHTSQPPYYSSFLYERSTLWLLGCLATLSVFAMIFRIFVAGATNFSFRRSILFSGLLLLGLSFVFNGVLSAQFVAKDTVLGCVIAFSFVAIYFFLGKTNDKIEAKTDYAQWIGYVFFLAALVIEIQVAKLLLFGHNISGEHISVFTQTGSINKDLMIAGWGMSNNVGGMLAIFLPATLFLAYRLKNGWIFYVLSFLQVAFICCTLSRSSILFAGLLLLGAAVLFMIIPSRNRKFFRIFNGFIFFCAVIGAFVLFDVIREIFSVVFDRGFGDSNRFEIWRNGVLNFFSAPWFGVGFFASFHVDVNIENWLFPDMYHNIVIQILASCGLFGIFAYTLHLSQIFALLVRKLTPERIFYFAIFFMISGTSLLDNHIFHVFPALLYSIILYFWESSIVPKTQGILADLQRTTFHRSFAERIDSYKKIVF